MMLAQHFSRSALNLAHRHSRIRAFSFTPPNQQGQGKTFNWLKETAFPSFAIGCVGGLVTSLAGLGGGFVVISLMTSRRLLNLSQHQAHGTSLCAIVATGLVSTVEYSDHVHYPEALAVGFSAMLTSRYGANYATKLTSKTLKRMVGIVMLAIAPLVPVKAFLHGQFNNAELSEALGLSKEGTNGLDNSQETRLTQTMMPLNQFPFLTRMLASTGAGLASGWFAGLTGVGGGTVVIPVLSACTDMTHHQILGTSLAAMTLPATVGTYTYMGAGQVVTRIVPPLAVGALFGGWLGSRLGRKTEASTLQWGFSALMALLGLRNLYRP